jgi:hypothetical protein
LNVLEYIHRVFFPRGQLCVGFPDVLLLIVSLSQLLEFIDRMDEYDLEDDDVDGGHCVGNGRPVSSEGVQQKVL